MIIESLKKKLLRVVPALAYYSGIQPGILADVSFGILSVILSAILRDILRSR